MFAPEQILRNVAVVYFELLIKLVNVRNYCNRNVNAGCYHQTLRAGTIGYTKPGYGIYRSRTRKTPGNGKFQLNETIEINDETFAEIWKRKKRRHVELIEKTHKKIITSNGVTSATDNNRNNRRKLRVTRHSPHDDERTKRSQPGWSDPQKYWMGRGNRIGLSSSRLMFEITTTRRPPRI